MFKFSRRSTGNLAGVHPDLVGVAHRALELTEVDFVVIEGRRGRARQAELVAAGASWTMDSRHLTGHAIDVAAWVGGRISWDWPPYEKIAAAFLAAAGESGVAIDWGGHWRQRDGGHFELRRGVYA